MYCKYANKKRNEGSYYYNENVILNYKEFKEQKLKEEKEAIDARNEADSFAFQTEKALKEVGDKVSESERAAVQADVDALKEAINQTPADGSATEDQIKKINELKEKLMNNAQGVFTKMYEQAQAANGGAQAGPQGAPNGDYREAQTGSHDDNVVDGDFREV